MNTVEELRSVRPGTLVAVELTCPHLTCGRSWEWLAEVVNEYGVKLDPGIGRRCELHGLLGIVTKIEDRSQDAVER